MHWIFLLLLLLFFLILLVPTYLNIVVVWNKKIEFTIGIKTLFGLIKFKVNTKKLKALLSDSLKEKQKIKEKNILDRVKKIIKYYSEHKDEIKYFREKIIFKKIKWITNFGLEDVALTGILAGVLWSIKSNIIVFLTNGKNIEDLNIDIIPKFNLNKFESSFNCIIKCKLAHIIIVRLYGLITKIKGGEKIVRTSH